MGRINRRHKFVDDEGGKGVGPESMIVNNIGLPTKAHGNQERCSDCEVLRGQCLRQIQLRHANHIETGKVVAYALRLVTTHGNDLQLMSLPRERLGKVRHMLLNTAYLRRKTV